jgi:hypothetical protein
MRGYEMGMRMRYFFFLNQYIGGRKRHMAILPPTSYYRDELEVVMCNKKKKAKSSKSGTYLTYRLGRRIRSASAAHTHTHWSGSDDFAHNSQT